jgi:multisubunit Na+/H+ antiporter MnhF subunit
VVEDGVFDLLLTLASLAADKSDTQLSDRIVIIQSLAAKAISALCSLSKNKNKNKYIDLVLMLGHLASFQSSIIELIKGTNRLSILLHSSNDEVRKYASKSFAFLSLRNGKKFLSFSLLLLIRYL